MSTAFTDITLRYVGGMGWLPMLTIERDGKRRELYRGEYHRNLTRAVLAAADALERIKQDGGANDR